MAVVLPWLGVLAFYSRLYGLHFRRRAAGSGLGFEIAYWVSDPEAMAVASASPSTGAGVKEAGARPVANRLAERLPQTWTVPSSSSAQATPSAASIALTLVRPGAGSSREDGSVGAEGVPGGVSKREPCDVGEPLSYAVQIVLPA